MLNQYFSHKITNPTSDEKLPENTIWDIHLEVVEALITTVIVITRSYHRRKTNNIPIKSNLTQAKGFLAKWSIST